MTTNPPAKALSAYCPECDTKIRFHNRLKLGQYVVCPECDETLEVVQLLPLKLSWAFDESEGYLESEDEEMDEFEMEEDEEEEGDDEVEDEEFEAYFDDDDDDDDDYDDDDDDGYFDDDN